MIDKKMFVEIINNIKVQETIDQSFSTALETVCDSYCIYNTNNKNYESLFTLLKTLFEDNDEWISWWIYEKDFGSKKEMKAYYKNDKEIKLDTPEQLYDFLIKNRKKK